MYAARSGAGSGDRENRRNDVGAITVCCFRVERRRLVVGGEGDPRRYWSRAHYPACDWPAVLDTPDPADYLDSLYGRGSITRSGIAFCRYEQPPRGNCRPFRRDFVALVFIRARFFSRLGIRARRFYCEGWSLPRAKSRSGEYR